MNDLLLLLYSGLGQLDSFLGELMSLLQPLQSLLGSKVVPIPLLDYLAPQLLDQLPLVLQPLIGDILHHHRRAVASWGYLDLPLASSH